MVWFPRVDGEGKRLAFYRKADVEAADGGSSKPERVCLAVSFHGGPCGRFVHHGPAHVGGRRVDVQTEKSAAERVEEAGL